MIGGGHDSSGRPTSRASEWIAGEEVYVGGALQRVLAGELALAREVTDFAGGLVELIDEVRGEPRAIHVGTVILARLVTELSACVQLIRLGYAQQAMVLVGTMLELMYASGYIGSDEARADLWLSWDKPNPSYPGNVADMVRDVARRLGVPAHQEMRDYETTYRDVCMVKHGNPLAMGQANLVADDETVHILVGPPYTPENVRFARIALLWAIRYALLGAAFFASDHLTDEQRGAVWPTYLQLRDRRKVLEARLVAADAGEPTD